MEDCYVGVHPMQLSFDGPQPTDDLGCNSTVVTIAGVVARALFNSCAVATSVLMDISVTLCWQPFSYDGPLTCLQIYKFLWMLQFRSLIGQTAACHKDHGPL
jgi:hypothetical protein